MNCTLSAVRNAPLTLSAPSASTRCSTALPALPVSTPSRHSTTICYQRIMLSRRAQKGRQILTMANAAESAQPALPSPQNPERTLICTIVTADTLDGAVEEINEAARVRADVVELRADYLKEFNPETDIQILLDACSAVELPAIFTYRPVWEGYPPTSLTHSPSPLRIPPLLPLDFPFKFHSCTNWCAIALWV